MKRISYSFVDFQQNIPTPPPESIKNAGLYTGQSFEDKPWGNKYKAPHIPPDAVHYAAQFYAKHHIPSQNRPGNNNVDTNIFKYYNDDLYNFKCYIGDYN